MSKLEAEMIVAGVAIEVVSLAVNELDRMGRIIQEGWDGDHDGHHDHSMLGWLHEKAERAERAAQRVREAVEQVHPEWKASGDPDDG